MKKVGIMQPYFVPYIGYWQLINAVDVYVVFDDVNYIKRGWINRNRILVGKEPQYINLQMSAVSQNKFINEIELLNDNEYVEKLFRTVELNYKKAPFFRETMDLLTKIFSSKESNLARFLFEQISIICSYLDIETKLIMSSQMEKNNDLKGEEKILDICQRLGAEEYYNAIGGQQLYSKENFDKKDITLKFLETERIEYKQFGTSFFENLSIIDVIMFNDVGQIKKMLTCYKLI